MQTYETILGKVIQINKVNTTGKFIFLFTEKQLALLDSGTLIFCRDCIDFKEPEGKVNAQGCYTTCSDCGEIQ